MSWPAAGCTIVRPSKTLWACCPISLSIPVSCIESVTWDWWEIYRTLSPFTTTKTWIRCQLAGGRSPVNLKFLGRKTSSSLMCPWQTNATRSALDRWIDAFSPHSCRLLSLPGSGGSLPAWSHLGSIRTSRQCACTGTYSPVYGSSWWCAGCYPPCSHSGHCSPALCGRTTIEETETETEMG